MRWGNRSILVRDPDGNLVSIFTSVTEEAIRRFGATRIGRKHHASGVSRGKCNAREIALGDNAVRQPRTRRSHKINMPCSVRPYTVVRPVRLLAAMVRCVARPSKRRGAAPPNGLTPRGNDCILSNEYAVCNT